jgi:hypothetical protein
MADEQADYSQVYDFIYRIDRRVGYLEKDAAFIEKQISILEEKRLKDFGSLGEELSRLRGLTSEIRQHFNACIHCMTMLSKDLKNTAKKEDIDGLNTLLDEMRFEEYVTDRDLKRGV